MSENFPVVPESDVPEAIVPQAEVKAEVKTAYKQSFKQKLRPTVTAVAGFLLGALLVFLALYVPESTRLNWANTEIERLRAVEFEHITLQNEHAQLQNQALIYKLLTNTSVARIAVLDNDTQRIDQAFSFIEEGIKSLNLPAFPNVTVNLSSQFDKVKGALVTNRLTAIDQLQVLFNDLLLLANNLE